MYCEYGCQQKQRIFVFCFLKSFVFFKKWRPKTKQKSENSPNKPIKISKLNRFSQKNWCQSIFELDVILNWKLHLKSVCKSWNISIKTRIIFYNFWPAANALNVFNICPDWFRFFIVMSESYISGPWKTFRNLTFLRSSPFSSKQKKNFENDFYWPETNLIWKNLEEIGANCGWFRRIQTYSN